MLCAQSYGIEMPIVIDNDFKEYLKYLLNVERGKKKAECISETVTHHSETVTHQSPAHNPLCHVF